MNIHYSCDRVPFVSYNNLIIVIQCIKWASFIHSCIGWSFDSLIYTVSQSISLTFISDSNQKQIIEWLNDWSSCSRFVAHRLWEMLRNENHWTDLASFFQSHKNPLQFTILVHSIYHSVLSASMIHFMYNIFLITVHTHFSTIFAGLLIHFQLWMIEIESDLDITTNHSYNFLCYNQI